MPHAVLRLTHALLLFAAGATAVTAAGLGARYVLVGALSDSLPGLPELQMERMSRVFTEPPGSHARLLILGDSTATFSVTARHYPSAESMATINSTSMEAYYTLRRLLNEGAKPACVLFSGSLSWAANHDYFWPMFVSGGFYPGDELEEIYRVTAANGDPPGAEGRIPFLARKLLYRNGLLDGYSAKRIQESLVDPAGREAHADGFRHFVSRELGSNPLTDHEVFEGRTELTFATEPALNASEKQYFARFASLLEEHGIRLFLLEVPFAETVPAAFAAEYWRRAEAEIAGARPGKPITFTRIAPPALPAAYYLSAGHLDTKGIEAIEPAIRGAVAPCFAGKGAP